MTQVRGAAYWRDWRQAHPEYRERQKRNRRQADRVTKRRVCACSSCRCRSTIPMESTETMCGFCIQEVHEE